MPLVNTTTNSKWFNNLKRKLQARVNRAFRAASWGSTIENSVKFANRILKAERNPLAPIIRTKEDAKIFIGSKPHPGLKPLQSFIKKAALFGAREGGGAPPKVPDKLLNKAALALYNQKLVRTYERRNPGSLQRGKIKRQQGAKVDKLQLIAKNLGLTSPGKSVNEIQKRISTRKAKLERIKTKEVFHKAELKQRQAKRAERQAVRNQALKLGLKTRGSINKLKKLIQTRTKKLAKRKR